MVRALKLVLQIVAIQPTQPMQTQRQLATSSTPEVAAAAVQDDHTSFSVCVRSQQRRSLNCR